MAKQQQRHRKEGNVVHLHPEQAEPQPPAQYDLFTGEAKVLPVVVDQDFEEELRVSDEILLARSADGAQVVLSGFGLFLSKKSDRLLVRKSKELLYEFPLFRLSEVTIASKGIALSTDLILELCQRGIQINFLHGTGKPYAKLVSPMLTATIHARREQIRALEDERGIHFSKLVVVGKLKNQRKLLLYFGKYLKKTRPDCHEALEEKARWLHGYARKATEVEGKTLSSVRDVLMGIEGVSARIYWEGVQEIIKGKADFFGRVYRGATDQVNAMLNYGYGILYSQVWGAVISAGLEPFAGFLHVDRPGKPSLVLDLVEEFRQPIVDRTVISFINLGETIGMERGLLDTKTRKEISRKVLERLESRETYRKKKYQVRSIIQIQARALASFLRGEGSYRPFSFRW